MVELILICRAWNVEYETLSVITKLKRAINRGFGTLCFAITRLIYHQLMVGNKFNIYIYNLYEEIETILGTLTVIKDAE